MEIWVILSISASLVWALVNLLDRLLLSEFNTEPLDFLMVGGVAGVAPVLVGALLGYLSLGTDVETIKYCLFSYFSGICISLFTFLYFVAMRKSSVQLVAIFTRIEPVFTMLWGYFFLHEKFPITVYGGGLMLVLGAAVSIISHQTNYLQDEKGSKRIIVEAALIMILAAFLGSISTFLQDIALSQLSTFTSYSIQRLGVFTVAVILFVIRGIKIRKDILRKSVLLISGIEYLSLLGFYLLSMGLTKGSLTLVSLFSSLQPVWVLLFLFFVMSGQRDITKFSNFRVNKAGLLISTLCVVVGLYLVLRV